MADGNDKPIEIDRWETDGEPRVLVEIQPGWYRVCTPVPFAGEIGEHLDPAYAELYQELFELGRRYREVLDHNAGEIQRERQLVRENEELARGILELQRKLTMAEKRERFASERWGALIEETAVAHATRQRAEGALQTAHNLAEMWRQRYERADKARFEAEVELSAERAERQELHLPLAYLPAGEAPEARWGLTELGERALRAGAVTGPEWVLLVNPDPWEVFSIEVRAGSRQETIYRTAGYVSADVATAAGYFLGLLDAFVEIAKAEDEELGRALHHLETLHLCGLESIAAEALARLTQKVNAGIGNADPDPEAVHPVLDVNDPRAKLASHSYDLAAVCARCGETYGQHLGSLSGYPAIPCDGFLAVAEDVEAEEPAASACSCCRLGVPAGDPGEFYRSPWCGVCGHPGSAHAGAGNATEGHLDAPL